MPDTDNHPSFEASAPSPATAGELRSLFLAGALSRDRFEAALAEIGVDRQWRRWCDLILLILGVGLLLAGIVFLVAYNWLGLDRWVRLAGLQALVVLCAVGTHYRGVRSISGRVLLFAACVLVGVYLAAFGQIYQTGADAWQLFCAWAGLIVLWVVASRSPVHWLLALAVTDAAIALYLEQVHFRSWESAPRVWSILAGLQAMALLGVEVALRRRYFLLPQYWPRQLLVVVTLIMLAVPTTKILFDDAYGEVESWLVLLGLAGFVFGGYAFYRYSARDLFAVTCIGFCCAWVITVLALRILNVFDGGGCGGLLLVGVLVVGMLTFLVRWVRRLHSEMSHD